MTHEDQNHREDMNDNFFHEINGKKKPFTSFDLGQIHEKTMKDYAKTLEILRKHDEENLIDNTHE